MHIVQGTTMLGLESPRWSELTHAYGSASDIPELLRQLAAFPSSQDNAEPWFSLWSALAHQGDVYPASFAAVPHVIAALASSPNTASEAYFHFPAWVEICRHKNAVEISDDLKVAYFDALQRIPGLLVNAASKPWSAAFTAC